MPDHDCVQEHVIEKLLLWRDGDNSAPGVEKRIYKMEKDFYGNGDEGWLDKVKAMWKVFERDLYRQGRRRISVGRVFEIAVALLNSGILLYLIQKL